MIYRNDLNKISIILVRNVVRLINLKQVKLNKDKADKEKSIYEEISET